MKKWQDRYDKEDDTIYGRHWPEELPQPPEGEIYMGPVLHCRAGLYHMPLTPAVGLLSEEWVLRRWEWAGQGDIMVRREMLLRWLSIRQWHAWVQQNVCDYCGAGIGQPCVSRRVHWAQIKADGLPATRVTVQPSYHHKPRVKASDLIIAKIPREAFPEWLWWCFNTVGEDADALEKALRAARGDEEAEKYLRVISPEGTDPRGL